MKKNVLITGGTKGIGKGITELFLDQGYSVAVCSRAASKEKIPTGVLFKDVDVRNRGDLAQFARETKDKNGKLDAFINCAGVSKWRPLEQIDEAFMKEIYETNVLGTLWGCQAALAVLKEGGCIINISSLAGKRGSANNSAYCASKFAVNGITQSLAKELGPRKIRVNSVCPVYVETNEILKSLEDTHSPAKGGDVKDYLKGFTSSQTALGTLPSIGNVAHTAYFLASASSEAITGQCINVDCGVFPQ